MLNKSLFSSSTDEWATPKKVFDDLDDEFGFSLDPCATIDNAKCSKYFTKADNGLIQSWKGERVFLNPPYGRDICNWVRKAYDETNVKGGAALVVLLLPARTDTAYFHDYIYGFHEIRFLRGRLHFNESKQSAPFPSMIVVMRNRFYI